MDCNGNLINYICNVMTPTLLHGVSFHWVEDHGVTSGCLFVYCHFWRGGLVFIKCIPSFLKSTSIHKINSYLKNECPVYYATSHRLWEKDHPIAFLVKQIKYASFLPLVAWLLSAGPLRLESGISSGFPSFLKYYFHIMIC